MSPKFLMALTTACIAFAPGAVAQSQTGPGASGSPNAAETTTVKSSKSNTSDRMGGGGGKSSDGAAKTTTVKSSKSNTSDRMGGGGGKSSN